MAVNDTLWYFWPTWTHTYNSMVSIKSFANLSLTFMLLCLSVDHVKWHIRVCHLLSSLICEDVMSFYDCVTMSIFCSDVDVAPVIPVTFFLHLTLIMLILNWREQLFFFFARFYFFHSLDDLGMQCRSFQPQVFRIHYRMHYALPPFKWKTFASAHWLKARKG